MWTFINVLMEKILLLTVLKVNKVESCENLFSQNQAKCFRGWKFNYPSELICIKMLLASRTGQKRWEQKNDDVTIWKLFTLLTFAEWIKIHDNYLDCLTFFQM